MSDLFTTMNIAANALRAFQTALDVTQNNVSNSQTPGYAKQVPSFDAVSLQQGVGGGVRPGPTQSARNDFAETAVRQQVSLLGNSSQLATSLDPIEQVFSLSDKNSISSALDALFQSFSAWSANPDDTGARTAVLNAATNVAAAFSQSANRLDKIRTSVNTDLQNTVDSINRIGAQIQKLNATQQSASNPDPGIDAQRTAALEQLSQLADVQLLTASNGTITVLLGGQVPLVTGDQFHPLSLNSASDPASVVDENGVNVTGKLSDGQLGALLSVRNDVLPRLIGDATTPGELNVLASQMADAVNGVFTAAGGQKLFTYDPATPVDAAATLSVTTGLQPQNLVAAQAGPPPVSNGVPLALSALAGTQLAGLQNMTFDQFYGSTASWIGNQLNQAKTASDAQTQTVAGARALREQLSGVSLDEEATRLMQLQRAYQAASRIVTVLDNLTQSVIDMIQ